MICCGSPEIRICGVPPGISTSIELFTKPRANAAAAAAAALQPDARVLPPYSPDLKPIEQIFAKLKALLRKPQSIPSKPSENASAAYLKPSARQNNVGDKK